MNIMRKLYIDAQANCGLHVGDWVRVIDCGLKVDENCGAGFLWDQHKQNMISKIYDIKDINIDGIWVKEGCFPYFTLEKISYEEAQDASGLKVGDYVKITKEVCSNKNGWKGIWVHAMSENISKVGVIKSIDREDGIGVFVEYGKGIDKNTIYKNEYNYPFFVLEKVESQEQEQEQEKKEEHQFKPFDKVLTRDYNSMPWFPDIFLYHNSKQYCCTRNNWQQCIPYEGNEHLVGKTDMPE